MKTRNIVGGLTAVLAAGAVWSVLHAQQAEVPYYADRITRPNVMLLIDTSGSMAEPGESVVGPDRTRLQVVIDVLTGRPVYHNGSVVFTPTGTVSGTFSVLNNDITRAHVTIFRVDMANYCDREGPYFVFYLRSDAVANDPEVNDAKSTLDVYMREMGVQCIRRRGTADIIDDPAGVREIWEPSSVCLPNDPNYLNFYDALKTYYWREEINLTSPTEFVVPMVHVPINTSIIWTDRAGKKRKGLCYATEDRCGSTSCFRDCYKPSTITSPFLMVYNDVPASEAAAAEELNDRRVTWQNWRAANPTVTHICLHQRQEVWGDRAYSAWRWWPNTTSADDDSPRSDGNTSTLRQIYTSCNATTAGAIPVSELPIPSDDYIRQAMVAELSTKFVTPRDILPPPPAGPDGIAGPEFQMTSSGTRIDIYLRQRLGINPINPPISAIDLTRPDYGKYFSLYYEYLDNPDELGIMDIYTDLNYGLATYDNSGGQNVCPIDDFYHDNTNNWYCYGADLKFNLTSWGGFPAYMANWSVDDLNTAIKGWIQYPGNLVPKGATPLAASVRDMYRYFYNRNSGRDPAPSMFFDLGYPNPKYSRSDHIVQDDPFYKHGCRRNFLIFLTDGQQTSGEPLTRYWDPSEIQGNPTIQRQIINWQRQRVTELRGLNSTYGVKAYFIGFSAEVTDDPVAIDQLNAMAAASDMPDIEDDITTPLWATDGEQLMNAFSKIMNEILGGQFVRSAPRVGAYENVIMTNYYDIAMDYPLWKGHLLLWRPVYGQGAMISEPYWSNENDLGKILAGQGSRQLFTALDKDHDNDFTDLHRENFTASNVAALKPYIDRTNAYTQAQVANIIRLVSGDPTATFSGDTATINWKLGPIFHSQPRIVRRPGNPYYYAMKGYRQYMQDHKRRPSFIVVGTGYGMIHGFKLTGPEGAELSSAHRGKEFFAYIPAGVLRYLSNLWEGKQLYGADGIPVVDDVYTDLDGSPGKEWRTVLVAGLGGGGTAYHALDLTGVDEDYDHLDVKPIWNFRDPHLGQTWSTPVPGLIQVEEGSGWTVETAVFFAGGINPKPDTLRNVGNSFYIINMKDGQIMGDDQQGRFLLGDSLNEMPGTPTIYDANGDGFYDRAYIGDLRGRVWKINFSSRRPDEWEACLFYDTTDFNGDQRPDTGVSRYPIWYAPTLARGKNNKLILYVSTGHVETFEAASNRISRNRLHAVVDDDPFGDYCNYATTMAAAYPEILEDDTWPLILDPGEKLIGPPIVAEGKLLFKTYLPEETDLCKPGTIRFWVVNYLDLSAIADLDNSGTIEEDEKYITGGFSHSELSLGLDGAILEATDHPAEECTPAANGCCSNCIDRNCDGVCDCPAVGVACEIYNLFLNSASPMSWGEGVNVNF